MSFIEIYNQVSNSFTLWAVLFLIGTGLWMIAFNQLGGIARKEKAR